MSTVFNEASAYEDNSTLQKEHGTSFISLLDPERGSKILDLGCGTGYLSKLLAGLVGPDGQVVAIDLDVERLKIAQDKYFARNLEYLQGSIEDKLPGEGYDLIFSNYVLHWVKRMDLVFQHVYRCLNNGGRFAFLTVAPYDNIQAHFTPSNMISKDLQKQWLDQFFFIDMAEIEHLASTYNFEITLLEQEQKQLVFEDVSGLIKYYMIHTL